MLRILSPKTSANILLSLGYTYLVNSGGEDTTEYISWVFLPYRAYDDEIYHYLLLVIKTTIIMKTAIYAHLAYKLVLEPMYRAYVKSLYQAQHDRNHEPLNIEPQLSLWHKKFLAVIAILTLTTSTVFYLSSAWSSNTVLLDWLKTALFIGTDTLAHISLIANFFENNRIVSSLNPITLINLATVRGIVSLFVYHSIFCFSILANIANIGKIAMLQSILTGVVGLSSYHTIMLAFTLSPVTALGILNYFRVYVQMERAANEETFLHQEPVTNIPGQYRLFLDGYTFDARELKDYAENCPENITINPHHNNLGRLDAFSDEAMRRMREHPVTKSYILAHEARSRQQHDHRIIGNEVYLKLRKVLDAASASLNRLEADATENDRAVDFSDIDFSEAQYAFQIFYNTMAQNQREALNAYIIRLPYRDGGTANRSFADVMKRLAGESFTGSRETGQIEGDCVRVSLGFIWRFVLEYYPQWETELPSNIRAMILSENIDPTINLPAAQAQDRMVTIANELDADDDATERQRLLANVRR